MPKRNRIFIAALVERLRSAAAAAAAGAAIVAVGIRDDDDMVVAAAVVAVGGSVVLLAGVAGVVGFVGFLLVVLVDSGIVVVEEAVGFAAVLLDGDDVGLVVGVVVVVLVDTDIAVAVLVDFVVDYVEVAAVVVGDVLVDNDIAVVVVVDFLVDLVDCVDVAVVADVVACPPARMASCIAAAASPCDSDAANTAACPASRGSQEYFRRLRSLPRDSLLARRSLLH
jgi:hypothetical protein